ncbi:MAG TPA: NAD(P)-dependent oxidoreductase [Spirochaetes bacterium]|nr:NAD(P)-dependent oxidoreductase [Spirochaetota bacterium]
MHRETIGWIGTGVMGRSMAMHILENGYEMNVYNRTKEKAGDLIRKGALWRENPSEVARHSDIIFTMVGYPADVEEVVLGEKGALAGARKKSVLIDMTTSDPSLAVRIHEAARVLGVAALDAPVSGGDVGAREGKLAIMAGGDETTFKKVLPLFKLMGENIALMGGPGAGQHTKMSNQILIASTMIGMVESLHYARRAGLDMGAVIDVIGKGAAASWSINNLGRRIVDGNFDSGFFVKHFVKDMGIALREAERMNLALPGLALAKQFYTAAMALGMENLGTQALYRVFERMNSA